MKITFNIEYDIRSFFNCLKTFIEKLLKLNALNTKCKKKAVYLKVNDFLIFMGYSKFIIFTRSNLLRHENRKEHRLHRISDNNSSLVRIWWGFLFLKQKIPFKNFITIKKINYHIYFLYKFSNF